MVPTIRCLKFSIVFALCASFFSGTLSAQVLINYDANVLNRAKTVLLNKTASAAHVQSYQALLNAADEILLVENQTVMDKGFTPPSNSKHDYLSLSRYWWPDPAQPDGLPWIRKDGETNPDTQKGDVDKGRIEYFTKSMRVLSFAYYFSGDERYAQRGVNWIKAWFLDEATRMNPNLQYAQSVPGNDKGRRSGILDGRIIPQRILDAITLFSTSAHWTAQDNRKMNDWLIEYQNWLINSELGQAGAEQVNNHGAWYSYQIAAIALYLQRPEQVSMAVQHAKYIFEEQFKADGSQPHELKRTRSYFYSTFNLDALTRIADIAAKANKDLWQNKASNGATLSAGITFLIPASYGEAWPYPSKSGVKPAYLIASLLRIPPDMITADQEALLQYLLADLQRNGEKSARQQKVFDEVMLYSGAYLAP